MSLQSFLMMLPMIIVFANTGELSAGRFDHPKPKTSCFWTKRNSRRVEVPVVIPVQSGNPDSLGPGKLLVASRELADPHFAKTVVLLVHFDDQGVIGLILNRRTQVPLSRVLEGVKAAKDRSDPVYLGGPVDGPAVFALFHSPGKVDGAELVFGGVYLISAKPLFEKTISTRPDPDNFHVYLGYAGWNKEQLRNEVKLGAWFVFPADLGTVFNSDPDSLWREMIRKTEMEMARGQPADRVLRSHADTW